jgi:hypothetical protein
VSCPHTHQQNGAIERKHRHLVETALSLLAQASSHKPPCPNGFGMKLFFPLPTS